MKKVALQMEIGQSSQVGKAEGRGLDLGGFLLSVQLLMLNETCAQFEGFPTHLIHARLFPQCELADAEPRLFSD